MYGGYNGDAIFAASGGDLELGVLYISNLTLVQISLEPDQPRLDQIGFSQIGLAPHALEQQCRMGLKAYTLRETRAVAYPTYTALKAKGMEYWSAGGG